MSPFLAPYGNYYRSLTGINGGIQLIQIIHVAVLNILDIRTLLSNLHTLNKSCQIHSPGGIVICYAQILRIGSSRTERRNIDSIIFYRIVFSM